MTGSVGTYKLCDQ